MKGLDGLAAVRQLRAAFPEARVVMVSNYDDAELRAEAAQAGACGYVAKSDLAALRQFLTPDSGQSLARTIDVSASPPLSESKSTNNYNLKKQIPIV